MDLNHRPPAYQADALTKLSYTVLLQPTLQPNGHAQETRRAQVTIGRQTTRSGLQKLNGGELPIPIERVTGRTRVKPNSDVHATIDFDLVM